MSFWKNLKPAAATRPAPTTVELSADRRTVALTWPDGAATSATAQTLRRGCPCAGCIDEWTGKRTLDPASVPDDATVRAISPVGNYALAFTFSDGHSTGLYVFELLRSLSKAP